MCGENGSVGVRKPPMYKLAKVTVNAKLILQATDDLEPLCAWMNDSAQDHSRSDSLSKLHCKMNETADRHIEFSFLIYLPSSVANKICRKCYGVVCGQTCAIAADTSVVLCHCPLKTIACLYLQSADCKLSMSYLQLRYLQTHLCAQASHSI